MTSKFLIFLSMYPLPSFVPLSHYPPPRRPLLHPPRLPLLVIGITFSIDHRLPLLYLPIFGWVKGKGNIIGDWGFVMGFGRRGGKEIPAEVHEDCTDYNLSEAGGEDEVGGGEGTEEVGRQGKGNGEVIRNAHDDILDHITHHEVLLLELLYY